MELVPWRPFGELTPFRKEMDRLWKRFFGEPPFPGFVSEEWLPSVDISEAKDKLLIKAELPGLEAKDINLSISGDILTIKGEKEKEKERKTNTIIIVRGTVGLSSVHFHYAARGCCGAGKGERHY
jgi:HSP20 family protein